MKFVLPIIMVACFFAIEACQDVASSNDPKNIHTVTQKVIVFDPSTLNAGIGALGTAHWFDVNVQDTDASINATIISAAITGPDSIMFHLDPSVHFPMSMPPHGVQSIRVIFRPTRVGEARALLTFTITSSQGTFTISDSLRGTVQPSGTPFASFTVDRTNIDFGVLQPLANHINQDQQTVTVTNNGTVPLLFTSAGANPSVQWNTDSTFSGSFVGEGSSPWIYNLPPDSSMQLYLRFSPISSGTFNGILFIRDTANTKSVAIICTGKGDPLGYPYADTIYYSIDTTKPIAINSFIWIHNTFSFPITLDGSAINDGVSPRINYWQYPATIASGDSLKYEFLYNGAKLAHISVEFNYMNLPYVVPVVGLWH